MTFQVNIYRNTIIDLVIPIGIILAVGIITFLLDFKNYGKTYDYKGFGLYFYSSMHYIFGYGFIVCSIFMLTNYYLADKESDKKNYNIVEKSSMPGSKHHREERKPLIRIDYDGEIKELVFNHQYYEKIDSFNNVELEVRKGFFGFDILENKKLN